MNAFLPGIACVAALAAGGTWAAETGPRAFDAQHGDWETHVRLRKPLSGSPDWIEYRGTTRVVPLLGGRANVAELSIAGPNGRIEGVAMRLYHPATGRWTIHYAGAGDGDLTPPLEGAFTAERAEFFGDDRLGERPVRVRFVITWPEPGHFRFEQAFSGDGGRTWETNWVAEDKRPGKR